MRRRNPIAPARVDPTQYNAGWSHAMDYFYRARIHVPAGADIGGTVTQHITDGLRNRHAGARTQLYMLAQSRNKLLFRSYVAGVRDAIANIADNLARQQGRRVANPRRRNPSHPPELMELHRAIADYLSGDMDRIYAVEQEALYAGIPLASIDMLWEVALRRATIAAMRQRKSNPGRGRGPVPEFTRHCVLAVAEKVAWKAGRLRPNRADLSRAFAICVAQGQKTGSLKPGTRTMTAKGKGRQTAHKGECCKTARYERMLARARRRNPAAASVIESRPRRDHLGSGTVYKLQTSIGTLYFMRYERLLPPSQGGPYTRNIIGSFLTRSMGGDLTNQDVPPKVVADIEDALEAHSVDLSTPPN